MNKPIPPIKTTGTVTGALAKKPTPINAPPAPTCPASFQLNPLVNWNTLSAIDIAVRTIPEKVKALGNVNTATLELQQRTRWRKNEALPVYGFLCLC